MNHPLAPFATPASWGTLVRLVEYNMGPGPCDKAAASLYTRYNYRRICKLSTWQTNHGTSRRLTLFHKAVHNTKGEGA